MLAVASIILFSAMIVEHADAQFSKAVIVLKGTVRTEETGKPCPVKISVRSGDNKAVEINSSQSNSISGNYLLVLQPKKQYWVVLESPGIITQYEFIETPAATTKTIQVNKNFTVAVTSAKDISEEVVLKKSSTTIKD